MNLLHQMREASMAGHALSKMYDGLDFNKDGNLTSTELAGLLSYMDNDSKCMFDVMYNFYFYILFLKQLGRRYFDFFYLYMRVLNSSQI